MAGKDFAPFIHSLSPCVRVWSTVMLITHCMETGQLRTVTLLNYTTFGFVVTFLISKRAYVKVKSTWRSEGLYQEGSVCCMLYSTHFVYSTREDRERAVM